MTLVLVLALAGCANDGERASTAPVADPAPAPMATEQRELVLTPLDEVDADVRGFTESLPRCTTLAQALELALASECTETAYAGLDHSSVAALRTVDVDLTPDACRASLRDYLRRLRRFHEWATDTRDAARNRQFFDFNTLSAQARRQTSRYERARDRVSACARAGG